MMLYDIVKKLVLFAGLLQMAVSVPAHALEAQDVNGLASEDLGTRIEAIEAIAKAGDNAALELLQLLYTGEVYVTEDGQVVLEQEDVVDAVTLEPLSPQPDDYNSVIVNNMMRGKLEKAIAVLSLLSEDRDTRFESAQALEGAEDTALLPVLVRALENETDEQIRAMLAQTKAVMELGSDDPAVRLTDQVAGVL